MQKCPKCSLSIPDGADSCRYCGAVLTNKNKNTIPENINVEDAETNQFKKCPYCAEEIRAAAVKCRFCGEFLDNQKNDNARPVPQIEQNPVENQTRQPNSEVAIEGVRVTISKKGRLWTENGKLHMEGSALYKTKLIGKDKLCDLSKIESIENKGKDLVIRIPGTYFVISFHLKPGESVQSLKEAFAVAVKLPLTEFTEKPTIIQIGLRVLKFAGAGLIFFLFVVVMIGFCSTRGEPRNAGNRGEHAVADQATRPRETIKLPKFTEIESSTSESGIKSVLEFRIAVPKETTKAQLDLLMRTLYERSQTIRISSFKLRSYPNSVYAWFFSEGSDYKSLSWIGSIQKSADDEKPTFINRL